MSTATTRAGSARPWLAGGKAPVLRVCIGIILVNLLTQSGARKIDADDCTVLLSWKEYATKNAATCSPLRNCKEYLGLSCDETTGKVLKLELSNMNLGGSLPASWSDLTSLSALFMFDNRLTGSLPADWSRLESMSSLGLGGNLLSGPLPEKWASMQSLFKLALYDNQLTGQLPPSWSSMTSLKWLGLYNNQLTGTLPPSWASLTKLEYLGLHGTGLAGPLPPSWSSLSKVTELLLNSTKLSGKIPTEWSSMSLLTSFNSSDTELCGSVPFPRLAADVELQKCSSDGKGVKSSSGTGDKPKGFNKTIVIGAVVAVCVVLAVVVALVVVCRRHGMKRLAPPQLAPVISKDLEAGQPQASAPPANSRPGPAQSGIWCGLCSCFKSRALLAPDEPTSTKDSSTTLMATAPMSSTEKKPLTRAETCPAVTNSFGRQGPGEPPAFAAPSNRVFPAVAPQLPAQPLSRSQANTARTAAAAPAASPYTMGPAAGPSTTTAAPGAQLALISATDGGDVGVTAALGVAVVLPRCMELATNIIAASERVVANNVRCRNLVQRIASIQPLLHSLERGWDTSEEDQLARVLAYVHSVFQDVNACISSWTAPSRMGSMVTIIRNMAASSWYQSGFMELDIRLSGAFTDLTMAMHIQGRNPHRPDRARLEAEAKQQTEQDLRGLVQDLVAVDENGHDQWSALEERDRNVVLDIFHHHKLDLTTTVKKAREEALDKRVQKLLIPYGEIQRAKVLGRGGFGEVWSGIWKGSVPVALKWLTVGVMTERDKADIKREAYIHNCAHRHPNICQLYGLVLRDPDECVLVMELLTCNLQQLLRDDDVVLPLRYKYAIALDVARGMEHLHSRNIVHGDLKPSNLLIHENGSVVLSDFGLSSISCVTLTSATMTAANLMNSNSTGLSVWYSPPELLDNRMTKKTKAGDVYGFAMVLLEIFTRSDPYGMVAYDAVLRIVLPGGRPKISEEVVPQGCADLIRRCWDQDPERRPEFGVVVRELQRLQDACA